MNSGGTKVRILIVDDHMLFRESVARLLNAESDFEVVSECGTIQDALCVISNKAVDLVLLDFDLEQQTGFQFFSEAEKTAFRGKVLVVTAGLSEREGADMMRYGAAGIFMKHSSAAALSQGIRQVMTGKVWIEHKYLRTIFETPASEKPAASTQSKHLSQRERRILSFILEGFTNKQIADRLDISESSVKAALQQSFDKAGVRTRSQLVRVALEQYRDEL